MRRIIRRIKRISIIPRPNKISPRTTWDINESHRSSDGFAGASLVGHFSGSPRRVVILDAYPSFSAFHYSTARSEQESAYTCIRVLHVCMCVYIYHSSSFLFPSSPTRHTVPKGFRSICDCPPARSPFFLAALGFSDLRFRFLRVADRLTSACWKTTSPSRRAIRVRFPTCGPNRFSTLIPGIFSPRYRNGPPAGQPRPCSLRTVFSRILLDDCDAMELTKWATLPRGGFRARAVGMVGAERKRKSSG